MVLAMGTVAESAMGSAVGLARELVEVTAGQSATAQVGVGPLAGVSVE